MTLPLRFSDSVLMWSNALLGVPGCRPDRRHKRLALNEWLWGSHFPQGGMGQNVKNSQVLEQPHISDHDSFPCFCPQESQEPVIIHEAALVWISSVAHNSNYPRGSKQTRGQSTGTPEPSQNISDLEGGRGQQRAAFVQIERKAPVLAVGCGLKVY